VIVTAMAIATVIPNNPRVAGTRATGAGPSMLLPSSTWAQSSLRNLIRSRGCGLCGPKLGTEVATSAVPTIACDLRIQGAGGVCTCGGSLRSWPAHCK